LDIQRNKAVRCTFSAKESGKSEPKISKMTKTHFGRNCQQNAKNGKNKRNVRFFEGKNGKVFF